MTPPPPLEDAIAGKAIEVVTGVPPGRSRSTLVQTLAIIGVVVVLQWYTNRGQAEAYAKLVERVLDRNAEDQKANREVIVALTQQSARTELVIRDMSETVRAAIYVARGADAPVQRQARRSGP
jgi:hypothetical protein